MGFNSAFKGLRDKNYIISFERKKANKHLSSQKNGSLRGSLQNRIFLLI